ncbi:signal peptide protein [Pseudomonas fluorescens]|uniref:Signal peptide protein n=1 Tax=Pseudomonas fluorescens TaxID=294 RepID=A0A379IEX1_PSEFL|nr:transporter [Pseudomonas fluorescens]AIG01502.1 quinohemoprotein alcohol dehydrogenase [Pseudomonas fluorescens]SUD31276.1 signal peptide protein [Pseudomonas fluorescens]
MKTLSILALLLSLIALARADVKPDPGDYTALPQGTDVVVLYQQNPRGDKVYSGGKKVADNLDLDMSVGVLRLIHFTEFLNTGLTWDPQIVIPFGYQKTGASDSKHSGLGDITFGGTVWTLADLANNEHLGWSMFVTAPTGHDKNQGFALSNNRWALDFQVGYIKGLTDKITWDVIAETEFYGQQRATDAKKDPLLQLHNHLRYNFTPQTYAALSYRHNWGARETLDHETLATRRSNGTLGFTVATMLGKQVQVLGQLMRDTSVREGVKIDNSLQFRLAYFY